MVAARRFGPLIVIVALGFLVLIARMYQVQVGEHQVWATEARNLQRSGHTIPYLRGRITDRHGQVFVQDEEAYAVEFVYREFRRHHPLGQVAHARSALENRGVALDEAARRLEPWGLELAEARAEDVERFARGEPARICGIDFPAVPPGEGRRRSRAADLRFYTRGLIGTADRHWNAVRKRTKKGKAGARSFVELVAEEEGRAPDEIRDRVQDRLRTSLERLSQLALQLGVRGAGDIPVFDPEEALRLLIEALDEKRREIEDRVAIDIFTEATGFHPGRLEPDLLSAVIELDWVGARFGWNPGRTESWVWRVREEYLEDLRTFHAPAAEIRARLRVKENQEPVLDALFGELAVLWSRRPRTPREWRLRARDPRRRDWRQIGELAVFSEEEALFEGFEAGLNPEGPPLVFVDPELRAARRRGEDPAALFEAMLPLEYADEVREARSAPPDYDWRGNELDPWQPPENPAEAAARVRALFGHEAPPRSDARDGRDLLPWLADLWERDFQASLRLALENLANRAARDGVALPLKLTERRKKRAAKKADYSTRDRSSRPEVLDEEPGDVVILYLTRYADEYRGFRVLRRTRRLPLAFDAEGDLVARELIGVVRESTLEEVIEQQRPRRRLSEILRQPSRTEHDKTVLDELVASLYRNDEVHGTSGIEGLCDGWLRGKNGYEEDVGLQEREELGHEAVTNLPIDGQDVELTLSIDLHLAAQNTIEHPHLPTKEDRRDKIWFQNPVGAIVLATVDGEILAAASGPKSAHEPPLHRDGERAFHYDRTLRRPQFQPVGSIFKPFVAAYALDRRGLEPGRTFACERRESTGTAGWGKVACWSRGGHGEIALIPAIQHSCNAYFAQVGELLEDQDGVRELARMFGFDRPSGVRSIAGGREGLAEDSYVLALQRDQKFSPTQLNRAGNGLEVIEASPVQVARAVAGLATGRLPTMRLVRSIGGEPVPPTFEPIPLSAAALSLVREGMVGVVREGSARDKGLTSEELRFTLAGKTGSADYKVMSAEYRDQLEFPPEAEPQMRKHTWFVGFFPAEEPRAVVVVYCHDIGVTSGHSAVHVAAQFLKTPEVQSFAQGALR